MMCLFDRFSIFLCVCLCLISCLFLLELLDIRDDIIDHGQLHGYLVLGVLVSKLSKQMLEHTLSLNVYEICMNFGNIATVHCQVSSFKAF